MCHMTKWTHWHQRSKSAIMIWLIAPARLRSHLWWGHHGNSGAFELTNACAERGGQDVKHQLICVMLRLVKKRKRPWWTPRQGNRIERTRWSRWGWRGIENKPRLLQTDWGCDVSHHWQDQRQGQSPASLCCQPHHVQSFFFLIF